MRYPAQCLRPTVRWRRLGLIGAILLATAGCNDHPELVPVTGKVLIDGQPLSAGNIKFVPEGARASWGALDAEGRFTLSCYERNDGAVPAKHRVQISALELLPGNKAKWLAPRKYADFRTSGIEQTITEPTEDLTIDLTWKGSPPGKPFIE